MTSANGLLESAGTAVAQIPIREGLVAAAIQEIEAGTTDTCANLAASVDMMIDDAMTAVALVSNPEACHKSQHPTCHECGARKSVINGCYRCGNQLCVINIHHGSCSNGD
jgi:hypothetical protein